MFKSTLYVVLLISTFVCVPSAFTQVYFFNKLEMATGKSPQSLAVGDFNKDGMPDFAVANTADNTVSVFLGKKDGTFQPLRRFRPAPLRHPLRSQRQILTAMASLTLP
jgi:FG-GAP-like repeat